MSQQRSRVSSALESADTVFFPYGLYKMAGPPAARKAVAMVPPQPPQDMMHPKVNGQAFRPHRLAPA